MEPAGTIGRVDTSTPALVRSPAGAPAMLLALVEGHDVFGYSEVGTPGWGQLYVLREDGTLVLLRSNSQAHIASPASDGTRLYWTETYGAKDTTAPQVRTELWSTPYTVDPTQLGSSASRFATITNAGMPTSAVAFGGLVALSTRSGVYIARLADGKVIQPSPGPSRGFSVLVAVTPSELWSLEGSPTSFYAQFLTRIGLGAW
jgi:hypothetical protein